MDQFDSSLDKEYESLNEAIMKALVTSKDVKRVLEDFKSKELINNLSVLNLVLSLEELSQLVFSDDHDFDIDEALREVFHINIALSGHIKWASRVLQGQEGFQALAV